ncbi:MAG: DUF3108 domain-containing protein [Epsilonproteobacteria bacterium]|nr:DUF3108 domain-containing protein [Campylobacterota bacterium]
MKRIDMRAAILIFLLALNLFSYEIEAKYKVTFGLFGKVGVSTALLERNATGYHIKVTAKATGISAKLSRHRQEVYESFGKVVNGRLVPHKFIKVRKNDKKTDIRVHIFKHKDKAVWVEKISIENGEKQINYDKVKFYAKDDILTLFFNLKYYLKNFETNGEEVFYAVGANKKDGHVNIYTPKGEEYKRIKRLLKADGHILVVIINQKIFSSKRGELYINLDDDGICTSAVLKDVIFFGDIRGILTDKIVRDDKKSEKLKEEKTDKEKGKR